MRILVFCFVVSALTSCKTKEVTVEDDKDLAYIDSILRATSRIYVSIHADITGYVPGRYGISLRAEVSGDDVEKVKPEDIKLFANKRLLEFSTAVGNYYERTSAHRLSLDEGDKITDSLSFSLRYKDSVTYHILTVNLRDIMAFVRNDVLYRELKVDKSKPVVIDWGGDLPDSVTVSRMRTHADGNVTTIESDWLYRTGWKSSKRLELKPQQFTVPNGIVEKIFVKWYKQDYQEAAHDGIGGGIGIEASAEQELIVNKSSL